MAENKNDEEKVAVTIRIPKKLHDKVMSVVEKSAVKNKTDAIIAIIENYFRLKEQAKSSILSQIDNIFSVENKIFLPKNIYKQLLSKSEDTVEEEIKKGIISSVVIAGIEFIIAEVPMDVNAVIVELLVQKKQVELIDERLMVLEEKD